MYRLSLDDSRLTLPVALYRVRGTDGPTHLWEREQVEAAAAWSQLDAVVCFALPPTSGGANLVPVYASENLGNAVSLTPPNENTRPLFFGLPLIEAAPGNTLEGSWQCRARMPDQYELEFPLRLSLQGETVAVVGPGKDPIGSGTFRDRKLTLTLETDDGAYILDGELSQRSLVGTWRKVDGTSKGTWSATAVDTTPAERRSSALTILREYRRLSDNNRYYSTEPQPPPGYQSRARELCKVWKVPSQTALPAQAVVPRTN